MIGRTLIALMLLCGYTTSHAQTRGYYPSPIGFVNDFEHDFKPEEEKALDLAVKHLLAKTMEDERLQGIELAVITVNDTMFGDEKEMSAYATKIGDKWEVGSKDPHRGIIIAYSRKVRKVAIVTGNGLDELLPPAACHKIIDEKMTPEFKKGKPFDALLAAVKGIEESLGVK